MTHPWKIEAVIFDLDGVIVSTDNYHYLAWKKLADEEQICFDRSINERLRGVSRMESLEIILKRAAANYTDAQKLALADRKNEYYLEMLERLTPSDILPGVKGFLAELKSLNIKMAVASSSRNSPFILSRVELSDFFDAAADGNEIKKSKPDPEVFLLAASRLNIPPSHCLVIEDAVAGVEAAIAGKMKVMAIGYAAADKRAHLRADNLNSISASKVLRLASGS